MRLMLCLSTALCVLTLLGGPRQNSTVQPPAAPAGGEETARVQETYGLGTPQSGFSFTFGDFGWPISFPAP